MDAITEAVLRIMEGEPIAVGLEVAAARTDGVIGIVGSRIDRSGELLHCGTAGVDDELVQLLEDQYLVADTNPVVASLPAAPRERLVHAGTFCSWKEFLRSPVYNDYSIKAGSHDTGAYLTRIDGALYLGTPGVALGREWPDKRVVARLEQDMRAVFRAYEARIRSSTNGLDRDDGGLRGLLLDEGLHFLNLTASQANDLALLGLLQHPRDVLAAPPPIQARVMDGIARAHQGDPVYFVLVSPVVEPYGVRIFPGPTIGGKPTVVLEVEPFRSIEWDQMALSEAYGLTPREASVALHLLSGGTTRTAGEELGLKRETLRSYLRTIYSKTGTGGQSQLVAVLAGSA